jgi:fatty-acyl-CoA synthase
VLTKLYSDLPFILGAVRMLRQIKSARPESRETVVDLIERWAKRTPNKTAIYFEDRRISYRDYDAAANRFARWAGANGIGKGDAVAILMENRPEFLFAWLGLAKIGAVSALLNVGQSGKGLAHMIQLSGARHLILGAELAESYHSTCQDLAEPIETWTTGGAVAGTHDLDAALALESPSPIGPEARADVIGKDRCFLLFTSGTTGMPKAAVISHARAKLSMNALASAARSRASDRVYLVLPLYHSAGGLCATGIALTVGGSLILRRRFSAHHFWDDCVNYRATIFQYVGELCRYLLNAPPHPLERAHHLRLAIGNGLRPDIWRAFKERFRIPRIVEFYAATEGNVSLFNFSGRVGAVGQIPPYMKSKFHVRVVKLDMETEEPIRGPDGFCVECAPGEIGEVLGVIDARPHTRFDGYTDPRDNERKILRDAFTKGDRWFRTGDLMKQDADGYFYFVDRIGDSFRWKGENVATSEVAEAVSVFPGVAEANVYGVKIPWTDGRAGMAALVVNGEIDLDRLADHLVKSLAPFARPQFLRLMRQMDATSTFKQRKIALERQGFVPGEVEDPLYVFDHEHDRYVPLDSDLYRKIAAGDVRF